MNIEYYLLNPTGNITVLVKTAVPIENQPSAAARLMEIEPSAEQVGFVSGTSLRMAGGEFCGNAAMSAAVLNCIDRKEPCVVQMNVSGVEGEISVSVVPQSDGSFSGTVDMPLPLSIEKKRFQLDGKSYTFPAVDFGGIVHLIDENQTLNNSEGEKAVRKWCGDLNCDAMGIMFADLKKSSLRPLVYVKKADTLFWESSCASGTSAAGAYFAEKTGQSVNLSLSQPGGTLTVFCDGKNIRLTGNVKLIKHPEIEL